MIAHLDCSTGVSGDKFLGALLDAGSPTGEFDAAKLQDILTQIAPEAQLHVERTISGGIQATQVSVTPATQPAQQAQPAAHETAAHEPTQPAARHLAQITELINTTELPATVKTNAIAVFTRLAEAEALVHGTTPEEVHFHEVGALDSIMDIVGTCAGLHALGVTAIYATPPALGSGTVTTAHGTLPVPAPATAALLMGKPTAVSTATGELTTPTGAALLSLAAGFGPVPPLTPFLLGYGAGTRDIGQPNVCRLIVGEPRETATREQLEHDHTVLLETNIDHITPEAVAFAGEELLAEGALDVWITPIAMKKGRAALTLSVLADPPAAEHFAQRMVDLTGTLGIRVSEQPRLIAPRTTEQVSTPWGEVTVKVGGGLRRAEHEDVARIARENDLPYLEVLKTITSVQ